MSSSTTDHGRAVEMAAESLLREHPDALVCGLSTNGLIVPLPSSIGLWGQKAIEGRAVTDVVVAADRGKIVHLWPEVERNGSVSGEVRLLSQPSRWVTAHCFDLRAGHGVKLCVILPSRQTGQSAHAAEPELEAAAPRYSTLIEDEGAKVVDCDEAFSQMFGYTLEEMFGGSVLDQIHPDDQGRAVEGWVAMLSSRRSQQTRMRRKRKDGGWVWVDTTLHNYLNEPGRNHVLIELIDVSAEMAAQEALQEREELLRRLTDAMPDGLLQLDTDQNVVYHNARLEAILHGAPLETADAAVTDNQPNSSSPGSLLGELLSPLTQASFAAWEHAISRVLVDGEDQDLEVEFVPASSEVRHALLSLRSLRRANGEVSGAIVSVLDVTDSSRARQELEMRATYDGLTGCLNRASILTVLQRALEQHETTGTAIIYCDLDNFKQVNDTLGHAAGDRVLVTVAERLQHAGRREDRVGRLGGDEFMMVLHDVSTPQAAMQVAERICRSLSSVSAMTGGSLEPRASVGVACVEGVPVAAEELVRRADAAMYESKRQRKSVPVLYSGTSAPMQSLPADG